MLNKHFHKIILHRNCATQHQHSPNGRPVVVPTVVHCRGCHPSSCHSNSQVSPPYLKKDGKEPSIRKVFRGVELFELFGLKAHANTV